MWIAWLALAVAGLLALLVLATLVPLHARVDVEREARHAPRVEVRLRWLFGLVRWRIRPGAPKARKEKPARKGRAFDWRAEGLLRQARTLVRRLWRALRIRELSLDARVGTGDPMETGVLVGALAPALALAAIAPPARIVVEPAWGEPTIEGRLRAAASVVPLLVLLAVAAFMLSRPARRAFWRRRA